jgi:dienelactone hydrolase
LEAAIPVERTKGPILLISGTYDGLWPSSQMSQFVMARLRANEHPYPYTHLQYERAGHFIDAPHIPTTVTRTSNPFGEVLFVGGSPRPNAVANADSWPKVLQFLRGAAG